MDPEEAFLMLEKSHSVLRSSIDPIIASSDLLSRQDIEFCLARIVELEKKTQKKGSRKRMKDRFVSEKEACKLILSFFD